MLASILRILFVVLAARFVAGLLARLGRGGRARAPQGRERPAREGRRPRVAGEIVDAEYEDLGDKRR